MQHVLMRTAVKCKYDIKKKRNTGPNLVNEGGEPVVEGLDLVLLLCADSLDGGVDFQVQRGQQALVDLDSCDRRDEALANAAKRVAHGHRHTIETTRARAGATIAGS